MSKRKSSGRLSGKRKRLVWFLVIAAVIIIIVVYETNQELRRQLSAPEAGSEIPKSADVALVPAKKAEAGVRGYYRSHDLPSGWKVGDTNFVEPDMLEVSLFFAPRIGDSRHGKAAARDDITAANACPRDAALLRQIAQYSLWIRVNDKTGLIDSFVC